MTLRMNSACMVALLTSSQISIAQNAPVELEPITLSAVRGLETPVDEATVSVTVLGREELEDRTSVNTPIGEVLGESVPGLAPPTENLTEYGQQLRGRNFLTLIDGVPQTNTLNNDFRALNGLSTSVIEQVEVIRGTTAAFGFGGAGGLVNIITKRPGEEPFTELSFGLRVQPGEASDSLAATTSLTTSRQLGPVDMLLALSAEQTGSSFTADGTRRPPDSYGSQGGTDDITVFSGLLKLGYDLSPGRRLEVSASIYDAEQDSDFAGRVSGGDLSEGDSATPDRGDLNTDRPGTRNETYSLRYTDDDLFGGDFDLLVYHNDRRNTFTRTEFGGSVFPQYETKSEKTGARLTMTSPVGAGVTLAYGIDLIRDETTVTDIDGPSGTPDLTQIGYAPFLQGTWDATERLRLTGGLRYELLTVEVDDFLNENGTAVEGGEIEFEEPLFNLSASYDLTDALSLYGGYSETFQLGLLARALADGTVASVDDASSEGQKTESYEIGLRGDYGAFDFSAAAFFSESNSGETYDEDLDLVLAPEEIWGVELTANYDIDSAWRIGGTASFIEGEFDTDGDEDLDSDLGSDRIPPTKITAFVQYTPTDRATYRLDALSSGSRNPKSEQFTGLQDIESYVVLDASARFQLGSGDLSLRVDNLLDADYAPVLQQSFSVEAFDFDDYYYVEAPGRTLSASYTVRF